MIDVEKMNLRVYPDPILKKIAQAFGLPLPQEIHQVAAKMLEIMYEENGIGLAGPQAGLSWRIIVFDLSEDRDLAGVMLNPEIIRGEGKCEGEEGCLSFPGIRGDVKRYEKVWVKGLNLAGDVVEVEADDLEATMFQHEIDHLNGVTFVDRLSPTGKMQVKADLKDLENQASF